MATDKLLRFADDGKAPTIAEKYSNIAYVADVPINEGYAGGSATPRLARDSDGYTKDERERYCHAGLFLKEGELGIDLRHHPKTPASVSCFQLVHSVWYCRLELTIAVIYMWVLALIEFPAVIECSYWISSTIDFLCIVFFLVNLFLHMKATGSVLTLEDYFCGHGRQFALQALVIALLIIDLGLSIAHPGRARVCTQVNTCVKVAQMLCILFSYLLMICE
eukprot:m.1098369 g.1098369  ORF g.1098369 m.1098369 type:complete len:221 (+) comp24313_c0_seq9:120-782(+)